MALTPPELRPNLTSVTEAIDQRRCTQAAAELKPLIEKSPRVAPLRFQLARAASCRGKQRETLRELRYALEAHDAYRYDPRLPPMLKPLLRRRRSRPDTMSFVDRWLKSDGAALILPYCYSQHAKSRKRAIQLMLQWGLRTRVDWVRTLAIDLDQTSGCSERANIVRKIADVETAEALRVLRRARQRRQKHLGFIPGAPVHACIRKVLEQAIAALSKKVTG